MKLSKRLKQMLHNVEWTERIRQMWLPMVFALCFGTVICVYNSQPKGGATYEAVEYEDDIVIDPVAGDSIVEVTADEIDGTEGPEETTAQGPYLPENVFNGLCMFFGLGYLLIGLLQVSPYALRIGKGQGRRLWLSLGLLAVGLTLLALDSAWIAGDGEWSLAVKIGHWSVYTALFMGIFVVPTLRQPNDLNLHRFSLETIITGALAGLAVGITTLALVGLLEGISVLFDVRVNTLQGNVARMMFLSVLPVLLVMLLPKPDEEGFATPFAQKLSGIAGKFIMLPLMVLYMVVLYVYILKIVGEWQLPDGTVTWMTTAMMAEMLCTVFLLYPSIYKAEAGRFWRVVRKAVPWLALPPLVLMSIGLARRVSDYGWTVDRIYVAAFNAWCYVACILLAIASLREKKVLSKLIVSFCVPFVLLSVVPGMNVAQYTQRLLSRQLEALIAQAEKPHPDHAISVKETNNWLRSLSDEQAGPIYGKLDYMDSTFGRESISRWVTEEKNDYLWWSKKESEKVRGTIFDYGNYNKQKQVFCMPAGYTRFQHIYITGSSVTAEEKEDGSFVLNFSELRTSIQLNSDSIDYNAPYLTSPLEDGKILLVTQLRISEYKGQNKPYLSVSLYGYLLSK